MAWDKLWDHSGATCPSRVSDSSVSAENIIYEAFVMMGQLWWRVVCNACMDKRKSGNKSNLTPYKLFYSFHFLHESNVEMHYRISPIKTKDS